MSVASSSPSPNNAFEAMAASSNINAKLCRAGEEFLTLTSAYQFQRPQGLSCVRPVKHNETVSRLVCLPYAVETPTSSQPENDDQILVGRLPCGAPVDKSFELGGSAAWVQPVVPRSLLSISALSGIFGTERSSGPLIWNVICSCDSWALTRRR